METAWKKGIDPFITQILQEILHSNLTKTSLKL